MAKRKYTYQSAEARAKAQARGRRLLEGLTEEQKRERSQHFKQGLETYREAKKQSKQSSIYKEYFDEVQRLRKQAKKLGKTLSLKDITGAPEQLEGKDPKEYAKISLGLGSMIDSDKLYNFLEEKKLITPAVYKTGEVKEDRIVFDNKEYTKEDFKFMLLAPKAFFKANSPF